MKNLILLLLLLPCIKVFSQCSEDRYSTAVIYYQKQGAGWELGLWPVQKTFGFFAGMNISKAPKLGNNAIDNPLVSPKTFNSQIYAKLQAKINERIALTATSGLQDGDRIFFATGLRGHIPLSQTGKIAIFGEPQYGSNGFFVFAGVATKF